MSDYAQAINQHYGQAELSAKILTALCEAGKDVAALTRDDLAGRCGRGPDSRRRCRTGRPWFGPHPENRVSKTAEMTGRGNNDRYQ